MIFNILGSISIFTFTEHNALFSHSLNVRTKVVRYFTEVPGHVDEERERERDVFSATHTMQNIHCSVERPLGIVADYNYEMNSGRSQYGKEKPHFNERNAFNVVSK